MRRIAFVVAGMALTCQAVSAADLPDLRPASPPPPMYNWSGVYFGGHLGGGFGRTQIPDATAASIYGGNVRTPTALGGMQLGLNWQAAPNWLFGVEADVSALNANGTATCFASSGLFLSANCRVRQDAMATVTGRAGLVTGPSGRNLFYIKGGAAWLSENIDIATNATTISTTQSNSRWGWTVGAGVERAIAPALSVKMEYDYADFSSTSVQTPRSFVLDPAVGYSRTPSGSSNASLAVQTVKLGLNMKFGGDAYARWDGLPDYHLRGALRPTDQVASLGEIEVGGRIWYSSGSFQKDLGSSTQMQYQGTLNSRLTYQSTAASGEVFGRIDGPSNVFLKGFVGGGNLLSGSMNDEDWIPSDGIPYSNTLSNPVKGSIGYGTIDVGYNLVRGAGLKVGGFIGYNYYRENKRAYGCIQMAAAPICDPTIDNSTLVIGQDSKWQSLRVGLNGVVMLTDQLKLTADAAYLPYVNYAGVDNHVLRTVNNTSLSPESGSGQGVQLEAILSYALTRQFSIGAGARYWGMWATSSDAKTNYFGLPCPCQTLPTRTERYGGFLEASYKFDEFR